MSKARRLTWALTGFVLFGIGVSYCNDMTLSQGLFCISGAVLMIVNILPQNGN